MIQTYAKELYSRAIALKAYDEAALKRPSKRRSLAREIDALRDIVCSMQGELRGRKDYAGGYSELAIFMAEMLSDCRTRLEKGEKGQRKALQRDIRAFHNLPRAFLDVSDPARVTAEDAMQYFMM